MKTFVPNTVELAFFGMLLGLLVGLPLGVLAGLKRGRSADVVARTIAILGQSAPLFWVGLMLMYFFAIQWPIFPVLGGGTGLLGTVLPSISLGFYMLPGILRITRSAMIEAMDSDFITLARIKGLSEAVVICKHALRNALIPIVTFSGMYFAILMSGVVVTGLGLMTFKAALGGDYPLLQGLVLLVTAVVIVINLIVDIAYVYIDPRIRYQKR
jgi:ABC-type dipeptide/oligopeptide/nickel transport system permease component